MPGLDALPADQRAVLQLLLRQGRSYEQIAQTLRLDPAAVRRRAHAGLAALADPDGLADPERARVADWLLGQNGDGAETTLRRDPAARAWADALSRQLGPVAARPLPAIPAATEAHAPTAVPARPVPAAAEVDAPTAVPQARVPVATEADTPAATSPAAQDAGAGARGAGLAGAGRPASRLGGAILLGALAVVAAIVAVVLLTRGGDDPKTAASTSSAPATTSTAAGAQNGGKVIAQVNMRPPAGAPAPKALAIAQVSVISGKQVLFAVADGLAVDKKVAWAIWAQDAAGKARWVGPFSQADENGRLYASGQVAGGMDLTKYKTMIVTREAPGKSPTTPGRVYLSGPIGAPTAAGGG